MYWEKNVTITCKTPDEVRDSWTKRMGEDKSILQTEVRASAAR